MSTRGFITFVVDGIEKTTYNHFDSYPDGLGVAVLDFARGDMQRARDLARSLQVVDSDGHPDEEQKAALLQYANLNVGEQSTDDWYCLLRETQGNPAAILASHFLLDGHDFPANSLFAEYGYVIDFDAERLEAYRGFQRNSHTEGRFADRPGRENGYYPVALAASWPFTGLPSDGEFVTAIDGEEAE